MHLYEYEEAVRNILKEFNSSGYTHFLTDEFVIRNHVTGNEKRFSKADIKGAIDSGKLLELLRDRRWDIRRTAVERD